jgi:flagellar basal-body rod modification protein FlgD
MEPITSSTPAATQTATAAQTTSTQKAQEQKNQFLQLLVAQIKGQNPLNPMEGSEFVSQLAQFSSLEELTHMRSTLDAVQQLLATQQTEANQTQEIF